MAFEPLREITDVSPLTSMEGLWMGNSFTKEDFQQFTGNTGSTYFSGSNQEHHRHFFENIVAPAHRMREKLQQVILQNSNVPLDDYVWFDSVEEMTYVPECMRLPLLYHPDVRALAQDGRIDTYGYDVSAFTQDNPWQRLIDNGVIKDVTACPMEDNHYVLTFNHEWRSTDPDLTENQLDCIEQMYALITEDLKNGSDISPTDRNSKIA